jgi:rRNA maturation endonuclease Nob1
MKTALNTADWVVCLAWSLGHATLTALVQRTAVNAAVTFDAFLLGTARESARRWVGRCAACRKAHRVDGMLARGAS